ncbi:MAG: DUF2752 domain-containing protein [Victivallales bacterium]|nr:DUF2752 domain-containing protein [Victivallales bacterium]
MTNAKKANHLLRGLACMAGVWRQRRWLRWCVFGGCLAVTGVLLWLLYQYPPGEGSFWPPCFLQRTTGLYCPSCGNTRALYALLHFDFATAFSHNVLFVPTLLLIVAMAVSKKLRHSEHIGYIVVVSYFLFMLLRNLPWYPCTLLAP